MCKMFFFNKVSFFVFCGYNCFGWGEGENYLCVLCGLIIVRGENEKKSPGNTFCNERFAFHNWIYNLILVDVILSFMEIERTSANHISIVFGNKFFPDDSGYRYQSKSIQKGFYQCH